MRRALEYEIRLSYYDRIVKSLPEAMHPPEAHTLPVEAPGPNFMFEDPSKSTVDSSFSFRCISVISC